MAYQAAQGKADQPVWVGTVEDLKTLVGQIEELAKYVHDKRIKRADDGKAARREEFMAQRPASLTDEERERRFAESERLHYQQFAGDTNLRLTIQYKRWDYTDAGTPQELFEKQIDVRDVKSINIALAGTSYATLDGYSLSVSLGENGATASIKAPEKQFIAMAASQLEVDFKPQRPWYWWFRAPWAMWVTGIPTVVAAPFVVQSFTASGFTIITAATFLVFFAGVTMPVSFTVMRLLARPFELVKEGAKSLGARQLGIIGATVVWVVGTILVPIALDGSKNDTPTPTPQPTQTVYVTPAG